MKEDIISRMNMVVSALNNVSVRGEDNLANLSGSIGVLKGIIVALQECDITPIEPNKKETENTQV